MKLLVVLWRELDAQMQATIAAQTADRIAANAIERAREL
jgi:hypothetical protein